MGKKDDKIATLEASVATWHRYYEDAMELVADEREKRATFEKEVLRLRTEVAAANAKIVENEATIIDLNDVVYRLREEVIVHRDVSSGLAAEVFKLGEDRSMLADAWRSAKDRATRAHKVVAVAREIDRRRRSGYNPPPEIWTELRAVVKEWDQGEES